MLHEAGISVSRDTLKPIAHDHRDAYHDYAIVKGVHPKKPELDDNDLRNRERYCLWIFMTYDRLAPKLIFVSYDEIPGGKPVNKYALSYRPPAFWLMICVATSTNMTLKSPNRPRLVSVAEEDEDRKETLKRVRKANEKAHKLIDNKRARAKVVSTQEEHALYEMNPNIVDNNKRAKAAN
ncbi:hypothetical protein EJ02DRAFT_429207 [Clathrospora elynae]|uniref:Uncharacterized protein n=1 Tax=Clathrospora elynae TaxID=706981 RepID=A0A6A5SAT9_9PLEO|nr:hypothetical protein EJ02DRAFT_429207 [Clathrospora elynae]